MKKLLLIIILLLFFIPLLHANEAENYIASQFMEKTQETENGIKLFLDKKYNKALDYFILLTNEGNLAGSVNAGLIYEHIMKNDQKAMHYYKIAAEGGNPLGQYNYGALLYFVNKNNIEAYKWILCSAKQNYSQAIFAKENMKETNLITKEQIKNAEILSKDC